MSILKNVGIQDLADRKLTRINWNFDYLAGEAASLRQAISGLSQSVSSLGSSADITYGTHAARLASTPPGDHVGGLYVETDRNNIIYQSQYALNVPTWVFVGGVYQLAQASISGLSLGTADAGLLLFVTDYNHVLQWSGSVWIWGPGESGSGYFQGFAVAPTAVGWHACDGSAGIKYLKADGTTGTVTLPNTASTPAYVKYASAYSSSITAAVAPTISAPALTMNSYTPAGAVSTPTLTMNSFTPTGTNSAPTFTGSAMGTHQHELPFRLQGAASPMLTLPSFGLGGTNYTSVQQMPVLASAFLSPAELSSAVSAGTPSGTNSAPTFTGNAATLTGTVSTPTFTGSAATLTGTVAAPTATLGGDPVANFQAILYFRK